VTEADMQIKYIIVIGLVFLLVLSTIIFTMMKLVPQHTQTNTYTIKDKKDIAKNVNHFVTVRGMIIYDMPSVSIFVDGVGIHLLGVSHVDLRELLKGENENSKNLTAGVFEIFGFLSFEDKWIDPNRYGIASGTPEQIQPRFIKTYVISVTKINRIGKRQLVDPFKVPVKEQKLGDPFGEIVQ
jgi:hypothetical protein